MLFATKEDDQNDGLDGARGLVNTLIITGIAILFVVFIIKVWPF